MSSNNILDVSKKKNTLVDNNINTVIDSADDTVTVPETVAETTTGTDSGVGTDSVAGTDSGVGTDSGTDTEQDSDILFNDLLLTMNKFKQDFSNLQTKIKNLEKVCKKEKKKYNKLAGKQNKGNKAPSGFAKPTNISDELCHFMDRETGSKVARTEVTQFITKYIEKHDLQKKTNRQYIIPNEPLQKLWDTKDGEEVTYFTIQRHMNRHFI
tara:strand:+ start:840 stop:1472 length:633 start_codon:yes stop_codon:yes gene_type:complete